MKNNQAMKLWYQSPASEYMAGLPVGTGRIAAMVIGNPLQERIALNHEWLWRGTNRNRDIENVSEKLSEIRKLLMDGKYEEGGKLANDILGGLGGISKEPCRVDPYQPAGDLHFSMQHNNNISNYKRQLDLRNGLVTISYNNNKSYFVRETLASLAHDLLFVHILSLIHI